MRRLAIVSILMAGVAGTALAAEVSRSVKVDAGAAEVWDAIGPFCAISEWHPAIEACAEEEVDGKPHRRLVAEFLEERLSQDDGAMRYGYAIIESPLPVRDYEATLSVSQAGDGAVITWESSFEPDGVSQEEAAQIIGGIYDAGLEVVRDRFAK